MDFLNQTNNKFVLNVSLNVKRVVYYHQIALVAFKMEYLNILNTNKDKMLILV